MSKYFKNLYDNMLPMVRKIYIQNQHCLLFSAFNYIDGYFKYFIFYYKKVLIIEMIYCEKRLMKLIYNDISFFSNNKNIN